MPFFKIKPWGDYPDGYKPEIHGPYDPSRYYGKPDTPLSQVKLRELPAWLGRRSYTPRAIGNAYSRAVFKFLIKYKWSKNMTYVWFNQVAMMFASSMYIITMYRHKAHIHAKYH